MSRSRVREASAVDDDAVLALMTEYMAWALATFESAYGFAMGRDAEHSADALAKFRRPAGVVALAEVDGAPAGVAALRVQDDGATEIKRMYVRPEHRGTGLGAELLDWLLDLSRDELRAPVVRLDSNRFMRDAHRLYESRGFVERPPYAGSEIPPELRHLWRFYELASGPAS